MRLQELGLDAEVRELADSTRTAREAADAVGVEVGQMPPCDGSRRCGVPAARPTRSFPWPPKR